MRAFLATPAAESFVLEPLPGYAPDLNPLDAGVWHLLKEAELGNVCCHSLQELRPTLTAALRRLRAKPRLIQACFGGAKLDLR